MSKLIVVFLAGGFAFGSASVCAEDAATKTSDQTPPQLPSTMEKQKAVQEATKQKALKERPLMGDFPQPRDYGRPPKSSTSRQPPKPSSDEARAERKRLVDEWEKSQEPAPAK